MKQKKGGLFVVIFQEDETGTGLVPERWFETTIQNFDNVLSMVRYMRKKHKAKYWRECRMFYRDRNVTLCQSSNAKADFKVKLRKVNYNNK